jgi:type IV pilus assembly protein PilC
MPRFSYKGKSISGKAVEGELEAESLQVAKALVQKRRIKEAVVRRAGGVGFKFGTGIGLKDMSRFTRQFSAMNQAGLPLIQCLDILSEQTENKNLAQRIRKISTDIQGGGTLAESMEKHKPVFTELYCQMVRAGEAGGILDTILSRLADYQEAAEALRRKVKGALTYPVMVAIVATGAVFALMTLVVPVFANMFKDMGGQLPAPTRMVMAVSDFLKHNAWWIILLAIGTVVGIMQTIQRSKQARFYWDGLMLKLPLFGDLQKKSAVARFCRTLGTLLSSGVPIIDALTVTARTSGNVVLEAGIFHTVEAISGGQSIAEPLKATGVFPPMVIQMIAVGERTGGLSDMLTRVSDFYDTEVEAAVEALTSMLEPLVIVVLGGVIGAVLIAMYLPMFEMAGAVK